MTDLYFLKLKGDCNRLENTGIRIKKYIDLWSLVLEHNIKISSKDSTSLSYLYKVYFRLDLMKTH